ncbi:MAG: hypothetical protein GXO48_02795 [Chlorobi bacterium]|nr:hypothetical protein [Chlorobiota bacterium]
MRMTLRRGWVLSVFAFFLITVGTSCHTWIWQPVKKRIVGQWKQTPIDKNKKSHIWEFDGSQITIFRESAPGSGVYEVIYQTSYSIKFTPQGHVIVAPLPHENGPTEWAIIELTSQTLYIANKKYLPGNYHNGNLQFGFVRIK